MSGNVLVKVLTHVIWIRFGLSGKGMFATMAGTVAAAVITDVVMHQEFENDKSKPPTTPTMPVLP